MMKHKLAALFTAALLAFVTMPVLAAGGELLINEPFDDYKTNETPASCVAGGETGVRVVEAGERNKALYLPAKSGGSNVTFDLAAVGPEFVVGFDLMREDDAPTITISLVNTAAKEHKLLTYSKDSGLRAHNGKAVGSVTSQLFHSVAIAYTAASDRYSVYFDGRSVAPLIQYPGGIGAPQSLKISVMQNEEMTGAFVDNVRAYDGTKLRGSFPEKPYNDGAIDYTEPETNNSVAFYVNDDYEKKSMSATMNKKTNEYGFVTEEDNTYLTMTRNTDSDMFIDVNREFTSRYLVVETDYRLPQQGPQIETYLRDVDYNVSYLFKIQQDNKLVFAPNGAAVATLSKGLWTKTAVRIDFVKKTADLYVDGELVYQEVTLNNAARLGTPVLLRYQIQTAGANGTLALDNMRVYNAPEIMEGDPPEQDYSHVQSIFPDDSEAKSLLNGKTAIQLTAGTLYQNNEKSQLSGPVTYLDKCPMVSARALGAAFGMEVAWDEAEQKISVGNVSMRVGSDEMIAGGKPVTAEHEAALYEGSGMLPLSTFVTEGLGKQYFHNEHGIALITDSAVSLTDKQAITANGYLLYERPDADKIREDLEKTAGGAHPRVMATAADFERIRKAQTGNETIAQWTQRLLDQADGVMIKETAKHELEGFRLLQQSRLALGNILPLGFAYQITGEQKYVDRAWKELEAVCTFPDWNPQHYLDVGEMSAAVAIGYDWMYDKWTDEQKTLMEDALESLSFEPSLAEYGGTGSSMTRWATADMNWNAVCNGGVGMGALAVAEAKPDLTYQILSFAVRGSEYFYDTFAPEGGFVEGPGYWDYALKYIVKFLSSMEASLGTDYNLSKAKGLESTALYALSVDSSAGSYNYHDCGQSHMAYPWTMWLGDHYNQPGLVSVNLHSMGKYQIQPQVYDVLFYKNMSITADDIDLAEDSYFSGTELVTLRSSWNSSQELYAAFHGGQLNVNHYHVDSGSFVFYALGEMWAVDLGSDDLTYSDNQYIQNREAVYRVRAEGHNVVVVNPDSGGGMVTSSFSPVEKYESKPQGGFGVMDLSGAYDSLSSYRRGIMLSEDRQSFTVRDEMMLTVPNSEVYWFMHMPAGVTFERTDYGALLTQNGRQMRLELSTNAQDYELGVMKAEPLPTTPEVQGLADNSNYQKLYFKTKASGALNIQIRMTPAGVPAAERAAADTPLSEWSIPDGELAPLPVAQQLLLDGKPLAGFAPDSRYYSRVIGQNDPVPEVTASADEGMAVETAGGGDVRTVRVSDPARPERYSQYQITFDRLQPLNTGPLEDVEGYRRYQPLYAQAGRVPEAANHERNVVDQNLETRWAADGPGQWLQLDYGEPVAVDAVCLAWMSGSQRYYQFQLQVSDDGESFTTVYDGRSSGTTDGYEVIPLEGVTARFVRYVGNQNSMNQWNSVTEFGALGKKEG